MNNLRQAILGILAALLSTAIILGSLSLAMTEGRRQVAQAFTPTPSLLAGTPTPGPSLPPGTPSLTPTPPVSPSPTSSCLLRPGWIVITIKPGDTIDSLAEAYGTTPEELASGNCLPSSNLHLLPGNKFAVPGMPSVTDTQAAPTPSETLFPTETPIPCGDHTGWLIYIVKKGDTLFHIAELYQTTVNDLMFANCLARFTIYPNQQLWVPNHPTITPEVSQTPTPTGTPLPTQSATPSQPPVESETPTLPPSDTPTATDTPVPTETPTLPPIITSEPPTPTPTETPFG